MKKIVYPFLLILLMSCPPGAEPFIYSHYFINNESEITIKVAVEYEDGELDAFDISPNSIEKFYVGDGYSPMRTIYKLVIYNSEDVILRELIVDNVSEWLIVTKREPKIYSFGDGSGLFHYTFVFNQEAP